MSSKVLSLGNIYFQIDSIHYPLGEKIEINKELVGGDYVLYPGSSALNFVRVAKSIGLSTSFIGKMGDDLPGEMVSALLEKEEINFYPIVSKNHQTNLAINYVADNADALMFVSGTANQSTEGEEIKDKLFDMFSDVDYFYLGGVFKQKKLLPFLHDIVAQAQEKGVKVMLDHNRVTNITTEDDIEIMKKLAQKVDYYMPSREELLEIYRTDDIGEIASMFKDSINIVVVKDAENGASGFVDEKIVKAPSFSVKIHNTVGAGDSFNAGFIKAQVDGLDLEKSLKFACATAALKISQKELPTYQQVQELCQMN